MPGPFRLASLLGLRRAMEDAAATELAQANADRDRAMKRRADTVRALSGVEFPQSQVTVASFGAITAARASLSARLTDHMALEQAAEEDAERARQAWTEAKTRTAALDKLAERHADAVRAEELHGEQIVLDEIASRAAFTAPTDPEVTL